MTDHALAERNLKKRLAFEREVQASASSGVRARALVLVKRGREEEAFALYEEAAGMHAEDDPSPAAAMCWFDLARTYERRSTGIRLANLLTAEGLFRRVLRSPAVDKEPHRKAKVRDALASCLRHIAKEQPQSPREREILESAAQFFEEAVAIASQAGPLERANAAAYLHNLANLRAQQGKLDAALITLDRAEVFARSAPHALLTDDHEPTEILAMILLHAGGYRGRRNRGDDAEQAIRQLREVIALGNPPLANRAHVRLASVLLDRGPSGREEARAELRKARADRLPPEEIEALAELYIRAGLRKEGLALLHTQVLSAMQARQQALEDAEANVFAAQAQECAHLAARLYAKEGEPLEAFLLLEYASGARFGESTALFAYRPTSPVVRIIRRRFHCVSNIAVDLDRISVMLSLVPEAERTASITRFLNGLRESAETAEQRGFEMEDMSALVEAREQAIERALKSSDPVGHLRRESQRRRSEAERIERRMKRLDPDASPLRSPTAYALEPHHLRELLREHEGCALIRFSVTRDLLVFAVWSEGGEIVARSHRSPLPPDLFPQLAAYQKNHKEAALQAITAHLASLDLSPALPPGSMRHAVLLPSFRASFLPLAALGPPGNTLLDRFEGLSWMPSLAPLFSRQAPHPPRRGVVTVVAPDTQFRAFAFATDLLDDEERLEGARCMSSHVAEAARTADVMCFFTHGKHEGEQGPELRLVDGSFGRSRLDTRWVGMERVELWACQSGVNLPSDPLSAWLSPPNDEIDGLDSEFLRVGVRSAIGTLWEVPDFVTAWLVREYRARLRERRSAPEALADAQRWWRDEGCKGLVEQVRRSPGDLDAAVRAFTEAYAAGRGEEVCAESNALAALLGEAGAPAESVERVLADLTHPLAWAGVRFVGVADRRPAQPWSPDYERPPTAEEAAEAERILTEEERPLVDFIDAQEEQLAKATGLNAGASPSPEQALRVARLYRDRILSSHIHNLLAALAWLHEALTTLDRTQKDAKKRKQARRDLALEAAYLWLDVARGEAIDRFDLALRPRRVIALERARQLLQGLPESAATLSARAWLAVLDPKTSSLDELDAALKRALRAVEPVLRENLSESYEGIRSLVAIFELVLLRPENAVDTATACLRRGRSWLERTRWKPELAASFARLRSAAALLAEHFPPGVELPFRAPKRVGPGLLSPRELVREELSQDRRVRGDALLREASITNDRVNASINALEGSLWGYPDDDRAALWRTTGTPGAAYRLLMGAFLEALIRGPRSSETAAQILACLHLSSDLRLPLLARYARFFVSTEEIEQSLAEKSATPMMRFWIFVRDRETLLEQLEEAALFPDARRIDPNDPSKRLSPHPLDPFHFSALEIQKRTAGPLDLLPWQLSESCLRLPLAETGGVGTAAFAAVRSVELLTTAIDGFWRHLLEADEETRSEAVEPERPRVQDLFDPGLEVLKREEALHRLTPGSVVLGLSVSAAGRLLAISIWNPGDKIEQRTFTTDAPVGWQAERLLIQTHLQVQADDTPARGAAAHRVRAWRELVAQLEPALDAVLRPALASGVRHIALFAPGSLRALPLLGLRVDGALVAERAASVVHLPTLSHESRPGRVGRTDACLLARERTKGDTSFGEAAVETLRRWFEPEVLMPPSAPTKNIVEAEQLDPLATSLRSLRFYGVSTVVAQSLSLAHMHLEGGRAYTSMNTRGLFLPQCEEVEIWAATAGGGPTQAIQANDRDRIPGLAQDFLQSGAACVLDLAWPVSDLVKALVCERYGVLRRRQSPGGPAALRNAIVQCVELLGRWRGALTELGSVTSALAWLDRERRDFAKTLRVSPTAVVPFVSKVDAPSIRGMSVSSLVEEACDTVHISAFRYWGWL